jgi:PST family polysaccharide transporter
MVQVAYYDVAEKVINIVKVPYSLIGQTLFPKVARDRNIRFLKRIMIYTVSFTVIIILCIFFFSNPIISFFSGSQNVNSINILRILSISLLPISISLFYGDLLLINFGLKTEYAKMRFFGFIFYLMIFMGLYLFKYIGVFQIALMIVAVESFVTFYSWILCRKSGLLK